MTHAPIARIAPVAPPAARLLVALGLLGFFALLVPGRAAHARQPEADRVRDDAGFFSDDAARGARQKIARIERDTGRKIAVETAASAPQDVASAGNRTEALARVAQRRVDELGVDVLIYATRNPGHLEVATGRNSAVSRAERDAAAQAMVAAFRTQQFDRGLSDTLDQLGRAVRSGPSVTPPANAPGNPNNAPGLPGPGDRPANANPRADNPPASTERQVLPGLCAAGGFGTCTMVAIVLIVGLFIVRRVLGSRGRGQYGNQYGNPNVPGGPYGTNQPGPYGGGYGNTGGGFGRGMMGGVLGGMLGGWLGNRTFGQHGPTQHSDPNAGGTAGAAGSSGTDFGSTNDPGSTDFSAGSSGGDFGGGGDSGGGGGGGDSGGSSGGDF
jgi:hypothetical protein